MSIRETARLAVLLVLSSVAAAGIAETPNPDFSGAWELNGEASDDPVEKEREARRASLDARQSPSRGGYGRRPPRGVGGGATDPTPESSWLGVLSVHADDVRIVQVEHLEPTLHVSAAMAGTSLSQTLYTDGRRFGRVGSGEDDMAVASWQRGGRLVVELQTPGGRSIRETWELVAEGSRLLITARLERSRLEPEVTYRRVFDRVEIIPWDLPD